MSCTNNRHPFIKLSPLILPWFFILSGLVLTVLQSFNLFIAVKGEGGGRAYLQVLGNVYIWLSLGFSLSLAFITAFFSTLIGFCIALLFWQLPRLWQRVLPVYKILLILPHISVAYIAILLFSRTGLLSSLFYQLGIIDHFQAFPVLVFDNQGMGIILGYLMKETPYVILMVGAHLQKIPGQMIQTAHMLGGGQLYVIRRVVIPSTLPTLLSTFLILFLYSFGGFEMPFLLGGSRPVMISVTVYEMIFRKGFSYRAEAMVVLLIILLINILVLLLFFKLFQSLRFRKLFL